MLATLSLCFLIAPTPQLGSSDTLVKDFFPGATPSSPIPRASLGDRLVFVTLIPGGGQDVWITEGTEASTTLLMPSASPLPPPLGFCDVGDQVIWSLGSRLVRTDGTPEGTAEFFDFEDEFNVEFVLWIHPLGDTGRAVVAVREFLFGMHLYVTDGTQAGTSEIALLHNAQWPAPIGDKIYFSGQMTSNDMEPWSTDGTAAGTSQIIDLAPTDQSRPREFTGVGDDVFFSALNKLWKTDGTAAGTVEVADPFAEPSGFVAFGDKLLFVSGISSKGEVWISDGTTAGTTQVSFIDTLTQWGGAYKARPVVAGSIAYFVGNPAANVWELWRTDGTTAGTFFLASLPAFPFSGIGLATDDGRLVFARDDESGEGRELGITSGTPATTTLLADIAAGAGSSDPLYFRRAGTSLYFAADDGVLGDELHAVTIAETGGWLASPYDEGCGAGTPPRTTTSGAPVLGGTFGIGVEGEPLSPAYLFLSADPDFVKLGGGCAGLIKSPLYAGAFATGAAGTGEVHFSIPNLPPIVGLPFYFQIAVGTGVGPYAGLDLSNGLEVVLGQ